MTVADWERAGLYDASAPDAAARLALLDFLAGQGCTVEEMTVAAARGRLFALAGDRQIRPVVGLLSLRTAAARLGADVEDLVRVWRTLGLPVAGPDAEVLTDGDVEALRTYVDVRELLGAETALGIVRVLGAALARVTEAESSAMRAGMAAVDVGRSGDELVTAQAFALVAGLVPRVGQMLDVLHRQHLEATRLHFEDIDREVEDRAAFRCGVGFADLSGFTRLSRDLPLHELSQVLTAFEESATDTVHAHGGRVVKFLGDAVMWVSAEPGSLVETAHALTGHVRATAAGIPVRAGLAHGRVLAQDGDYFGPPVNLAARLVAVAQPWEILAPADLVSLLGPSWTAVEGRPQRLRGFDEPIVPWSVQPA